MQAKNDKLTKFEVEKLEQDYINSNSAPFIKKIQSMVSSISKDIEYLGTSIESDFDELYTMTKDVTPAALPYAELTTLVFKSKDIDHFIAFSIRMDELYTDKFKKLKEADSLHKTDYNAISAIAKSIEHLNLAIAQKNNLYDEQTVKLNELDISGNKMTQELINHKKELGVYRDKYDSMNDELEEYKAKYDKMTIDFLSMMGIFSTIIFAVFGGLSQIGAIGDNLAVTPITKILMYLSLSAITLLSIVFISFNAISKLTGMNLRSCSCSVHDHCNHKIYEKHPTLSFSLFFFIDLFILSLILRASTSSDWVEPLSSLINFNNSFETKIRASIMLLFIIINLFFGWNLYKIISPKKKPEEDKDKEKKVLWTNLSEKRRQLREKANTSTDSSKTE